jgi:periplasmic divalent cation tolerance protein
MTIIYTTFQNKEEARKITTVLLEKKLIACANMLPTSSAYLWEGKIERKEEIIGFLKTTEEKFVEVREMIRKLHSYDVPCILKIPAEAERNYREWVEKEVE